MCGVTRQSASATAAGCATAATAVTTATAATEVTEASLTCSPRSPQCMYCVCAVKAGESSDRPQTVSSRVCGTVSQTGSSQLSGVWLGGWQLQCSVQYSAVQGVQCVHQYSTLRIGSPVHTQYIEPCIY